MLFEHNVEDLLSLVLVEERIADLVVQIDLLFKPEY